ncbi:MAG: class I SAM-dependent methyltransferase [Acidimicrobiales bacterium]|jgi:hypothetical protein|nr:class I SAM-dependent methyltransferase [Acidimicrobiales bacterium]
MEALTSTSEADRYFVAPAAAFVRGSRPEAPAGLGDAALCAWGLARGVRLHRFKRTMPLPRVERVLGALAQLRPATVLDVGPGRGTFLWPLLDRFPDVVVTGVEADPLRAGLLATVTAGGYSRLQVLEQDMAAADPRRGAGPGGRWDVVTALEVLEHVDDPAPVARACVAAAVDAVVVSVPATPDDNPGHVRLFDRCSLTGLLEASGARRVAITQVPGHLIAVATRMRSR